VPPATAPHSYVELHCHSAYSLLDGASLPEALVERAATLGHRALALTDHDELGGIVAFAEAARDRSIAGIIGAEVTVDPSPQRAPEPASRRAAPAGMTDHHHLVLLAESAEGYANLSTLITRARMDSPRGRPSVSLDTLARHARGLFALTGCPRGLVPSLVARGDPDGACEAAATLLDIFERRVAIECWNHSLEQERAIVPQLIAIARSLDVPWVVTNDVHYAEPRARIVHDVLCSLRHEQPLDAMGTRLRPNGEWYLKSAAQMRRRWQHAPDGIRATLAIAERCAFRLHELRPTLPAFPLPPGVSADEYLARLAEQGAWERWGERGGPRGHDPGAGRRQLQHELAIIQRLGLAGYFLIVWDIVRFARRDGVLCQGRGSAANSAVCFCLGITAVDPIKLGLLFERFLSDERQGAPDIDIDFAHRDRERVLQYVYERYGREHAAMVCEQITYREKSAVKDVCRVMGLSVEQAEARIQGAAYDGPAADIVQALQRIPRHRSIHVGGFVLTEAPLSSIVPIEPASMPDRTVVQWEKDDVESMGLVKIDLLGLGMLTLIQDCLLYIRATRGHTLDLADLDYADQAVYDDLCRADTIGVFQVESRAQMNTLPRLKPRRFYDLVVEVALIRPGPIQGEMVHPYLRRRAGEEAVTYPHPSLEPILARTLGIPLFQEQGMQVAIAAAGFTPGEADMLRKAMGHKRSHERMAAICEKLVEGMRRNGIAEETARRIYSQINAFADYGFPESHAASFALLVYASAYLRHYYAPEFTAAILNAQPMGFYSPGTLIEDARRHGVEIRPVDVTRSWFDSVLEAREARLQREAAARPAAGLPAGSGGREGRLREAPRWPAATGLREAGGSLRKRPAGSGTPASPLPPAAAGPSGRPALPAGDAPPGAIAASHSRPQAGASRRPPPQAAGRFPRTAGADGVAGAVQAPATPSAPAVRLGLRLVRGLGARARESLERALRDGGPFQSIGDLVHRSGLDRRALRALAEAGALDSLVPDEPGARQRRAAVWRMLEEFRGSAGALAPPRIRLDIPASVPAMSPVELTAADYRMTGVSFNGHPMQHLRAVLAMNDLRSARELSALRDGSRNVAVAGLVICRQRPPTARGFAFLTLEDETGLVNVVVTPKRFERQALLISNAPLLLVRGTLQVESGVVNLRGEFFRELKADVGAEGTRSHDFR